MYALDSLLISSCNAEQLKHEFLKYKTGKTDALNPKKVRVPMGVDGVSWKAFERDLDHQTHSISQRIQNGSYFFSPFREVIVPKSGGGERTISIASIRDVLIQRKMSDVLTQYTEDLFNQLPLVSFAYRPLYSAPQAIRNLYQYMGEGYAYVLDADIISFFDEIPHQLLLEQLERLFQKDNPMFFRLMKRFISVDRVEWETYKGDINLFYTKKPKRTARKKGIPQGGILSGLIANLYLHPFDEWVMKDLGKSMDLKYIRYADDFVILARNKTSLLTIKNQVKEKLSELGLQLHADEKKTKCIHTAEQSVEFLGFDVSPTGIRIKNTNIHRFKQRILDILKELDDKAIKEDEARKAICHIQYKLFGNEANGLRICKRCKRPEERRSWLQFFLSITDVQQVRGLDQWIRKKIYHYYFKQTGKRLKRSELMEMNIQRLEHLYYSFRKEIGKRQTCICLLLCADYHKEPVLNILFKEY